MFHALARLYLCENAFTRCKWCQNFNVNLWRCSETVMNSALLLRYYLKESFWSALMDHFHFPSLEFQSLFIAAPLFGISSILGPDVAEQTLCFFVVVFFKKETKNLPPSLTGSQGSYLTAAWQPLKNCQIHLCLQPNAAPRQQNPLLITNQIWFLCQEGATQFFLQSGSMLTDKPMSHFYLHQ